MAFTVNDKAAYNVNDEARSRAAYFLLYTAGSLIYFALPAWGAILSEVYGFNNVEIGWLLSADMITNSLANVTAMYWIHRVNWRGTVILLVVGGVAANLLCMGTSDFFELMTLRCLAGFFAGAMVSLAVAGISATSKPDSNFGYALSLQVASGALMLLFVDGLVSQYGADILYVILSLPVLLCLGLLRFMPSSYQHSVAIETSNTGVGPTRTHAICLMVAFLAIALFFAGMNSLWSFAELLAGEMGIDGHFIGTTLSVSLLASAAGSMLAGWLGGKLDRLKAIVIGVSITSLALLTLLLAPGNWLFFLCLNVFNFGYNFVIPFQSGWVASLDTSGNNIVLLPAIQGAGISAGPIITGFMISDQAYSNVIYLSVILIVASAVAFVPIKQVQARGGAARDKTELA